MHANCIFVIGPHKTIAQAVNVKWSRTRAHIGLPSISQVHEWKSFQRTKNVLIKIFYNVYINTYIIRIKDLVLSDKLVVIANAK